MAPTNLDASEEKVMELESLLMDHARVIRMQEEASKAVMARLAEAEKGLNEKEAMRFRLAEAERQLELAAKEAREAKEAQAALEEGAKQAAQQPPPPPQDDGHPREAEAEEGRKDKKVEELETTYREVVKEKQARLEQMQAQLEEQTRLLAHARAENDAKDRELMEVKLEAAQHKASAEAAAIVARQARAGGAAADGTREEVEGLVATIAKKDAIIAHLDKALAGYERQRANPPATEEPGGSQTPSAPTDSPASSERGASSPLPPGAAAHKGEEGPLTGPLREALLFSERQNLWLRGEMLRIGHK